MRILQVSPVDIGGGAERSCRNLASEYRRLGHESWVAVGSSDGESAHTLVIPNDAKRNVGARAIDKFRRQYDSQPRRLRGVGRAATFARSVAEPLRSIRRELGVEDFDFPGTADLLELPPARPDILHLHNLHGGYFDLSMVPSFSRQLPTVLNLRDAWLMTGHCALPLDCEKWRTGCGHCPDLTLFPSVSRDATRYNWRRKQDIFARTSAYVTTPSVWMMNQVNDSIVSAAARQARVIPNGVDTSVFFPGDRLRARQRLGLPAGAAVAMTAAKGLRRNVFKDFETLLAALGILGARDIGRELIVLAVGESSPAEQIGNVSLRFIPFVKDDQQLADCYRAADVYVHAALVESFGNVLLESRACGTPVIATAVGGIPEQVQSLEGAWSDGQVAQFSLADATGVLVPARRPDALAEGMLSILQNAIAREKLADNGLGQVLREFTLERQARRFLEWYDEIIRDFRSNTRG